MKKQLDSEYYKELLINLLIGGLFSGLVWGVLKQRLIIGGIAFLYFVIIGWIVFPMYEKWGTKQEKIKYYKDVLKPVLIGGMISGLLFGFKEQNTFMGLVAFLLYTLPGFIIFPLYEMWRTDQENVNNQINKKYFINLMIPLLIGGVIFGLGCGVIKHDVIMGTLAFLFYIVLGAMVFPLCVKWRAKQEKG